MPPDAAALSTRAFLARNARWLAAGGLLTLLSSFGQTFFISIFSGEIQAAHGLTPGGWGLIYTLGTAASAVAMLWAGAQADRRSIRGLGTVVLMGLATACLLMAMAPAPWALLLAVFALRLAGQGMTGHVAMVAMARWFDRTRGRAISVAALGFSLGEAVLPLLFVALLGVAGFRPLWALSAALILLAIPVVRRLLSQERTPQGGGPEPRQTPGMDGRHWRRGEVLRSRLFWAMVPTAMGPSAVVTAFFFLQVHLAEAKGWSHLQLVALFPLYTATAVGAMLAAGWAIDRFGSGRLVPVFMLPLAASFLVMAEARALAAAALAMVLMGLTQGVNSTLAGAFWAEFFGTRHLGAIRAMTAALMVLGSAVGPGVAAALIDAGLAFEAQMPWIAGGLVGASALTALAIGGAIRRLPRRPGPALAA